MRLDIRFAGMTMAWSSDYTMSYAKKLKEMGYSVRIAEANGSSLIAYSYRSFKEIEMQECLNALFKIEGNDDSLSESV